MTVYGPAGGGAGGGGGPSLPSGGVAGQVLIKQSGDAGDAAWQDTAALSNDLPLPLGAPASGTSTDAMRADAVLPPPPVANRVILAAAASGRYSWPIGYATPGGDSNQGRLILIPLIFDESRAVKLGVNCTTAGVTGALIRFGIYEDSGAGIPGAVSVDLGTVAATATGILLSSASFLPVAGRRYWGGYVVQGAPSPVPTLTNSATDIGARPPIASFESPGQKTGVRMDGVTGALATFVYAAGVWPAAICIAPV